MGHRKQTRANDLRLQFAEKWMRQGHDAHLWRIEQSKIGRSKDQPGMLAHRPWICTGIDDEPPPCNTQVLEYFKIMVLCFISHREWRRHAHYYWEEVPDKEDWLGDYWNMYLRARTANDPWSDFGPLHPYMKFDDEAKRCSSIKAGFAPPDHEVKCWQSFEDLLHIQGYPRFWNPSILHEDR